MKKQRPPNLNASSAPVRKATEKVLKARLSDLKGNLFKPVDVLPLGIFRSIFGLLLCVEFVIVSRDTFPADYVKPLFHFTYPLFDMLGLRPLPQAQLWIIFYALQLSTVGIMLGLCTRISLIVFTSAFGYFLFMESAVYTNHYYLIFLLSLLLCIGHSGSAFSLDSLIRRSPQRVQVEYWEVLLLRFQICVVFFFGAVAKVNSDWLIHAAPVYLNLIKNFSFVGYPLHERWMAVALSWGGMVSDLALGILLVCNRWPKLTFLWLCLFNGLNACLFGLGIKTFPYLMISTYILFLPTATVRRFMARHLNGYIRNEIPANG